MNTISIWGAIGTGWKKFTERPWYLIAITLAVMVLFAMGSAQNALYTALGCIIYAGYLGLLIKHYRGERIQFDGLFPTDNRWISFAFVLIIKGLFIMLGLLLFVIPGIYLGVKWSMAELLVVDRGMRPMEALRASSAMTRGHRSTLFFFGVVGFFITLLGLAALVVGVVVSALVLSFATIHIYETLKPAA